MDIENSQKTVGCYIYDTLLQNPQQKIIGKLVKTIERKYYKEELRQILQKQCILHCELQDKNLYKQCVEALYPSNEAYRTNIVNRDFVYLLMEDILFYQRPLKSKKSLIDNCPYEEYEYVVDKHTGEVKKAHLKCIAKSHPLYQEFRLWQFLYNLRIYQKEKEINGTIHTDVDVTSEFLKIEDDYVTLFDWLNRREKIEQKTLLKYPAFNIKKDVDNFRWNYVEDKTYPCNETRSLILSCLNKSCIR